MLNLVKTFQIYNAAERCLIIFNADNSHLLFDMLRELCDESIIDTIFYINSSRRDTGVTRSTKFLASKSVMVFLRAAPSKIANCYRPGGIRR